MANIEEKKSVTGLDLASDRKEAEYDLVASLLEAAEYKTDESNISEVSIDRNGKHYFTVRLHPVSDTDARFARKKATIYMKNPNGPKLPPIEKEFNSTLFNSWLIYLATTEEDQAKIWGNPELAKKHGLVQPVDAVDLLLMAGEKSEIVDLITKISGMDDEDDDGEEIIDTEEYAKN